MTALLPPDQATLVVADRADAADGVVCLTLRRPDGGPG